MNELVRKIIATMLCPSLILPLPGISQTGGTSGTSDRPVSLQEYLQKPYEDLFQLTPTLSFPPSAINRERQSLTRGEQKCREKFTRASKNFRTQLDQMRKQLRSSGNSMEDGTRHQLHCSIQNAELLKSEADVLAGQAIPHAFDNLQAKLDLIEQWPQQYRINQATIADGSYQKRRWADVKDIGFRQIASGQEDDIKRGKEALDELKRTGLLPPELESKPVNDYVRNIAERVASHSDLKVPLHVSVLQSREINAFALPGGYLFIQRGLLEEVEDEAQLAGVIAHELAHDTARHSAKMMKRASIAGMFYQAAQIAAVVLTGGVAGIGLMYALQYGFYGLGMVLDLRLLGVSRDYELEADQLGIQYAWNAGYDTTGFIRFFDKMATRAGYVNGVSWFRTHPPFYARMMAAEREIMFLPEGKEQIVQTSAFLQMKQDLAPIAASQEKEEVGKPSLLLTKEEGCEPPRKLEYKPGQPIEQLCSESLESPKATSE
ncbi:MAG TPA: M48 family metalloprotease [Terracidiphilus sp.]|nr:M48 family metalloprotease [Terracidiphilus sp.]